MRKLSLLIFFLIFFCSTAPSQTVEEHSYEEMAEPPPEEVVAEDKAEKFATPSKSERGEPNYNQRKIDPKFKDDYKGEEFNYHKIKKQQKNQNENKSKPLFNLGFLSSKILMYALLIIMVLLVVYFVIKNSGGFSFSSFKDRIKINSKAKQVFEDTDDIGNNDFGRLIQKAKSENNYRLAIRYYFLWILQSMSDKKLIQWNSDKTNYDYFVELQKHPIQSDFYKNSHIYDYIWYGNFELNSSQFKTAETIFQKTLNKLK